MRYQAVRAAIESPLQTAFGALSPAVPVFFDNITAAPANATTEYVKVAVEFGLTTEQTLESNLDRIRGSIVIRVYTEKGKGPARNQTLMDTVVTTLLALSASTGQQQAFICVLASSMGLHFQQLKGLRI